MDKNDVLPDFSLIGVVSLSACLSDEKGLTPFAVFEEVPVSVFVDRSPGHSAQEVVIQLFRQFNA